MTDVLVQARAALDVSEHHSYEDHLDSLTEVVPALVAEVERLRAQIAAVRGEISTYPENLYQDLSDYQRGVYDARLRILRALDGETAT